MKKTPLIRATAFVTAVFLSVGTFLTLQVGATKNNTEEDYLDATYTIAEHTGSFERSIPSVASRTGVNINGRRVLEGRVLVIDGITYVPMQKFADWLGVFRYSTRDTGYLKTLDLSGENLQISATENNLYIIANGRYFYTVGTIKEIDGEVYVPIEPLVKALNSRTFTNTSGAYSVTSGDTRRLKSAEQTYREDEVMWLARIISAEAKGESMQGKIAVGNVVLNRTRSSQFPNTIYSVIFDRKYGVQFAPTANGAIYNTPTADSVIAAKMCLEGYAISNEILYFFNPRYSSGAWVKQNREYAFTLGNHVFYN